MIEKKKTVGEEAVKLLANPDTKQGIIDTEREVNKEYFQELKKCVENHSHIVKPFYIVVHVKKEQLLENVIRRYFISRISLPTPQWDQDVWRYSPASGDLRHIWTLPDENTAKWMASEPHNVPIDQHELLQFVVDFLDMKLYHRFLLLFPEDEKTDIQNDSIYSEVCKKAKKHLVE